MLATSLQQWARRYLRITQKSGQSPHKRARKRAYFAHGIQKFQVPRVVETLPVLVHLSIFVFFVGLLIYLFNVHHTVFSTVMCWIALLTVVYGSITFMPMFWHDSPYYSPLSQPAWSCYTRILHVVLKVLYRIMTLSHAFKARRRIRKWIDPGSELTHAISKHSARIDLHVLRRIFSNCYEDDSLEKVFESIPGFFKSDEVNVSRVLYKAQDMIEGALRSFLYSTLSSNSVPESVKVRRLATCLNTAGDVLPPTLKIFVDIFNGMIQVTWDGGLDCVKTWDYLRSWDKTSNGRFTHYIRGVITVIVASVQDRNKHWVTLARDHLGVPDHLFQGYLKHGNSVLLANLIHFTRHANRAESFALDVVQSLSRFDTRNTLPELQREFCAMWNDVVFEAQNGGPFSYPARFLGEIHHHHHLIHQAADAAPTSSLGLEFNPVYTPIPYRSSYSLCNIHRHRSPPMHHTHSVTVAEAALPSPSSRSDDITTQLADDLFPPSPVIPPSYLGRQVSQLNPSSTTPSNSAASTSVPPTTRHPAISSSVTSDPDPSTLVATTSIPELIWTPLDVNTIDANTIDAVLLSPSMIPMVSFPSSPPPLPEDMPPTPTDPLSSPTPSSSQSNKPPPGQEPPSCSSTTAIPIFIRRSSLDYDPDIALSVATDDGSDKSHGQKDS